MHAFSQGNYCAQGIDEKLATLMARKREQLNWIRLNTV